MVLSVDLVSKKDRYRVTDEIVKLTSGEGNDDAVASDDSTFETLAEPNDPSFSFVIFQERESTAVRDASVRMAGSFPKCFSKPSVASCRKINIGIEEDMYC